MKIKAIIEKGPDGRYSVFSEDHIGNSYFGGYGKSVAIAKDDFNSSIKEAIAEEMSLGHPVPKEDDIKVLFRYDIPSFFNCFDFLNVSKFAEYAGINESKMRAYKTGSAYPGEKTMMKISNAVKSIGQAFLSITL